MLGARKERRISKQSCLLNSMYAILPPDLRACRKIGVGACGYSKGSISDTEHDLKSTKYMCLLWTVALTAHSCVV